MALNKKEHAAFDILRRAVRSFEKKTGEPVFLCSRFTDQFSKTKTFIALGPRSTGEEFFKSLGEGVRYQPDRLPVPDVSNEKWWTTRSLRQLIPVLVRLATHERPRWREEDRPEWWPQNVPYISPRQGLSVVQMQRVVVKAYVHFESLHLLGRKGEEIASWKF